MADNDNADHEDMSRDRMRMYQRGRDAWDRIRRAADQSWEDWAQIGETLQEARREVLESTGANDMQSKLARNQMTRILAREKLDEIDKGVRSDLLALMDERSKVEAWRATLTLPERMAWNYPRTLYKHFKKRTKVPTPDKDEDDDADTAKPKSYKQAYAQAQAENDVLKQRLKTEASLFSIESDTAVVIARVMVSSMPSANKVRAVIKHMQELLKGRQDREKAAKQAKTSASHAG